MMEFKYAMFNDVECAALPDALPLSSTTAERQARDALELATLRTTVATLLAQIRHGAACTAANASTGCQPAAASASAPVPASAPPCPAQQAEFISMLAHELRNPMQPIAMASGMLKNMSAGNPTIVRMHAVLDRQINHMGRLLDDLLDGARAATGKIAMRMHPVLLSDVIDAAIETSQPCLQQRHQNLRVRLPQKGIVLSGDATRLAQAFSNLLINASQFTHPCGHIVVTVTTDGDNAEITVTDDGPGIAPELKPVIFDLFTQGQRTLERAQGGLGIGLFLVRTIVDLHGGRVTVESAGAGSGSTFAVTLPLGARSLPPPVAVAAPAQKPGCRILVIEDDIDANEIMVILLQMDGHDVTSRFDGVSGLSAVLSAEFDIVLCDLSLPGLNGFEVNAGIRSATMARKPMVIATTGYSDATQFDLAHAAGFDHYLVKPLDVNALLAMIAAYRGQGPAVVTPPAAG
jgi:signal transduction histidine kinase/ActR/RegA family two-component response regulator